MNKKFSVDGGSQTALRVANRQRVIDELARRGSMTQAEIARSTGLAASTVSNIINELIDSQRVTREDQHGGPHGQQVSLIPAPGLVLGIDLGARHLTLILSDLAHHIVAEQRITLKGERTKDSDLAVISSCLDSLLASCRKSRGDILAAAMAMPAPLDREQRKISFTQILPGWQNVDIVDALEGMLDCPVVVDNDANLGAIGEYSWGGAQGVEDLVYVKMADGIGAGLLLGGKIYRGADGSAGEIGHATIDNTGLMCRCGNRGCLETVASIRAIRRLLEPIFGPEITIGQIIDRANEGNTACIRALEDSGRVIGIALANLANTINPRRIVVGGVLADAGSIMIDPIQEVLSRNAISGAVDNLQIQPSTLGARVHALGAVTLALGKVEL